MDDRCVHEYIDSTGASHTKLAPKPHDIGVPTEKP